MGLQDYLKTIEQEDMATRKNPKSKKYGGGRRGSGRKRKKNQARKIRPDDDMDILEKQYV